MEQLKELYYDPATGFGGVNKIYKRAKALGLNLSKAEVAKFIKSQETEQVFARRKVKHHFPLVAYAPFARIQIDLADVSQLSHWNKGIKFLFCALDVFTRKAFVVPMKSKSDREVLTTFTGIVDQIKELRGFPPVELDSDQESSFRSRAFKAYCAENLIFRKFLPLDDYKGTAVVERFIRTIRELINRYLVAYSTKSYLDVLDKLVENYNTRVNQGIRTAPDQAMIDPTYEQKYWGLAQKQIKKASAAAEQGDYAGVQVGEKVRVLLRKQLFDKGTAQKWSTTTHLVESRKDGLYFVSGRVGGYKGYELQRVGDVGRLPQEEEVVGILENEAKQVKAGKRMDRAMRKEGVDPVVLSPRTSRVKKPRDFGPVILQ
jgi:transposase InsO family protein